MDLDEIYDRLTEADESLEDAVDSIHSIYKQEPERVKQILNKIEKITDDLDVLLREVDTERQD